MINMQEELLQQLVDNKDSFQVIVSDDTTRFTKKFNPPIQLKKNRPYEIALVNRETYYSIPWRSGLARDRYTNWKLRYHRYLLCDTKRNEIKRSLG